jgi:hypothetical protein
MAGPNAYPITDGSPRHRARFAKRWWSPQDRLRHFVVNAIFTGKVAMFAAAALVSAVDKPGGRASVQAGGLGVLDREVGSCPSI